MRKQYSYLKDRDFLTQIDSQLNVEQWAKITLLEYNSENPIEEIQGEISSGTINKDGSSAVRRNLSLSCNVNAFEYDIESIKSKYSISKKVFVELGITNNLQNSKYNDEIIWIPQGVFFITSCVISASANGAATLSLQFKDKMATLDGTLGGTLAAGINNLESKDVIAKDGTITTNKTLVYDIIMEAVNHLGGEDLDNIIIDDIDRQIKRIIRWNGDEPIYIIVNSSDGNVVRDVKLESECSEDEKTSGTKYIKGQDIGYMWTDFIYDTELSPAAGSKVTDILDTIKNWLGNYEYFYDEYGVFHFQEIKNYMYNNYSSYIWGEKKKDKFEYNETSEDDYSCDIYNGETVYSFTDDNIISITNTPSYENIKNEFIVQGTKTENNVTSTITYHLAIDQKPDMSEGFDNVLIYKDPSSKEYTFGFPQIITPTPIINTTDTILSPENFQVLLPPYAKFSEDDNNETYIEIKNFSRYFYLDYADNEKSVMESHNNTNQWVSIHFKYNSTSSDGEEKTGISFTNISNEEKIKKWTDYRVLSTEAINFSMSGTLVCLDGYEFALIEENEETKIKYGDLKASVFDSINDDYAFFYKIQELMGTSTTDNLALNWVTSATVNTISSYWVCIRKTDGTNTDNQTADCVSALGMKDRGYIWKLPEEGEEDIIYCKFEEPKMVTTNKTIRSEEEFKIYYNQLHTQWMDYYNQYLILGYDNSYEKNYLLDILNTVMGAALEFTGTNGISAYKEEIFMILQLLHWCGINSNSDWTDIIYTYTNIDTYYQKISSYDEDIILTKIYSFLQNEMSDERFAKEEYFLFPSSPLSEESTSFFSFFKDYSKMLYEDNGDYIYTKEKIKNDDVYYYITAIDELEEIYSLLKELAYIYEQLKTKKNLNQNTKQEQLDLINKMLLITENKLKCWYAYNTYMINNSIKIYNNEIPQNDFETAYISNSIILPTFTTSFWYYNSDTTSETCGWQELEWCWFYKEREAIPTDDDGTFASYYHEGLGACSYIDFSDADMWYEFDYTFPENWETMTSEIPGLIGVQGDGYTDFYEQNIKLIEGDGIETFGGLEINDVFFSFSENVLSLNTDAITAFIDSYKQSRNKSGDKIGRTIPAYGQWWQISDSYPSMMRYSSWYKNYYIPYVENKNKTIENEDDKILYFEEDDSAKFIPCDWRLSLIIKGMIADRTGIDTGHYYQELKGNWPAVYDYRKNERKEVNNYYFFDMIDSVTSRKWGEYSVNAIGRRTNVTTSDSVNCLFDNKIPLNVFYDVTDMTVAERNTLYQQLLEKTESQYLIQVNKNYSDDFITATTKVSAYEQITLDLQQHTTYQNVLSLTACSSFWLEPNTRVHVLDRSTGTIGDYIVKTISIPLGTSGSNMSCSLSKVIEYI